MIYLKEFRNIPGLEDDFVKSELDKIEAYKKLHYAGNESTIRYFQERVDRYRNSIEVMDNIEKALPLVFEPTQARNLLIAYEKINLVSMFVDGFDEENEIGKNLINDEKIFEPMPEWQTIARACGFSEQQTQQLKEKWQSLEKTFEKSKKTPQDMFDLQSDKYTALCKIRKVKIDENETKKSVWNAIETNDFSPIAFHTSFKIESVLGEIIKKHMIDLCYFKFIDLRKCFDIFAKNGFVDRPEDLQKAANALILTPDNEIKLLTLWQKRKLSNDLPSVVKLVADAVNLREEQSLQNAKRYEKRKKLEEKIANNKKEKASVEENLKALEDIKKYHEIMIEEIKQDKQIIDRHFLDNIPEEEKEKNSRRPY